MAALTKSTRDSIRNKILKHRFDTEEAALHKALRSAGDRVYEALYSKAHRDLMNSAPDGFYARRESDYVKPPTGDYSTQVKWTDYKPLPYCDVHGARTLKLPSTETNKAIWNAYTDASQALKSFGSMKSEARVELDGVLAGFTTLKQLRDNWPEIADFIPPDPVKTGNNLVKVKDVINTKYKLPPKGKKDAPAKTS